MVARKDGLAQEEKYSLINRTMPDRCPLCKGSFIIHNNGDIKVCDDCDYVASNGYLEKTNVEVVECINV